MDMSQRVRKLDSDDSVTGSSNFGKFIKPVSYTHLDERAAGSDRRIENAGSDGMGWEDE